MKKHGIVLTVMMLVIVSKTSYAATCEQQNAAQSNKPATTRQIYASFMAGGNSLQDQYWAATEGVSGATFQYRFGANGGMSVGLKLDNWRSEVNFLFMQNKLDDINGANLSGKYSGTYSTSLAILLNFIHDFHYGEHWVPYLGLGLGSIHSNFNDSKDGAIDDTKTATFGYDTILGLGYQPKRSIRAFIEYRHVGSAPVTIELSTDRGAEDYRTYYQNNLFDVGLSFFFDI